MDRFRCCLMLIFICCILSGCGGVSSTVPQQGSENGNPANLRFGTYWKMIRLLYENSWEMTALTFYRGRNSGSIPLVSGTTGCALGTVGLYKIIMSIMSPLGVGPS
jgi:hypothetical protein